MKVWVVLLLACTVMAKDFVRFPFPGLPSTELDGKEEYKKFRKQQQAYLLINMLRVDPQKFVERFVKPVVADDSWKLMFKTEELKLRKYPDYYPLLPDTLLEQTAETARLGESYANVRARLKTRLPKRFDSVKPGYKSERLLAQTLIWKTKTQNDFFSYLCHGHYQEFNVEKGMDLSLSGCKSDYVDRKTPRGRIRFLLRPTGVMGCNLVKTMVPQNEYFACDVTYPDFSPRLRQKSPMVAGHWFNAGTRGKRYYSVVIHTPRQEKVTKVELITEGQRLNMPLDYFNGVSKVYTLAHNPCPDTSCAMKGFFFHAVVDGKDQFFPAQYYYDWNDSLVTEAQRFSCHCKTPYPDRTCQQCHEGYRRDDENDCVKCLYKNCKTCTANECVECLPGWGKNSADGYQCTRPCDKGCSACDGGFTGYCTDCDEKHFLNATDYTCEACDRKFQDCATCDARKCKTYKCEKMDPTCPEKIVPGMFFSSKTNKCEKCSTDCHKCVPDNKGGSRCLQCVDGMFLTSEGECIACHYVDGCLPGQCDGNQCIQCRKGFYKKDRACVKCDDACAHCESATKCRVCKEGWFLDEEYGKCMKVHETENCETKSALGYCTKCKFGYGFDKYMKCVACDAACEECHWADRCTKCKKSFYKRGAMCEPCSKRGCDLCDEKECFSCLPNAYLHMGQCVQGPAGCQLCESHAPTCRICDKGMKMVDGHCIPDCDVANCARCNGDETCRYCRSVLNPYRGYEPAPSGKNPCPFVCDPVELNCLVTPKMKRGTIDVCFPLGCKLCPKGHYRHNFRCVKCPAHCESCFNGECTRCERGKVLVKGECMETAPVDDGECACDEFLDKKTHKCKTCVEVDPHCKVCSTEGCEKCDDNFRPSANKDKCEPCNPDKECRDKDKPCPDGFSYVNGECKSDPNCLQYKPKEACEQCKPGFVLNDKHICEAVPEPIPECKDYVGRECVSCLPGYVLVDEKCVKCDVPDCAVCDKTQQCTECIPPKYLNGEGKCVEAVEPPANCTKPVSEEECAQCIDGTRLTEEGKCEPCISNCKTCDPEKCTECLPGYYLNVTTGMCEKCKDCICDATGQSCIGCESGKFLNENNECQDCYNGCARCVVDDSYTVICTVCADGSSPVNGSCPNKHLRTRSGARSVAVVAIVAAMVLALF